MGILSLDTCVNIFKNKLNEYFKIIDNDRIESRSLGQWPPGAIPISIILYAVCITRRGQKSDSFFRGGGGGGGGAGGRGGGGSSADLASTLFTSCIVYVYFTKCRRAGRSVCADDKWQHWYNRTATN